MTGHLREVRPGYWRFYANADPDPISGARRQRTRYFRGTKTAAKKALAAFVTEIENESLADVEKITVRAMMLAWLGHRAPDLEPNTLKGYRSKVGHVIDGLGSRRIGKLTTRDVEQFYASLRASKAPNTVLGVHRVLHAAYEFAVRAEWVDRNPTSNAETPSRHLEEPSDLDPVLVAKVLEAAPDGWETDDPPLRTVAIVAAVTGAREAELCGLRWSDLDRHARTLLIRRRVVYVTGGYVVRPLTKSKKPRIVGLDRRTVARLRLLHYRARLRARQCGGELPADAFVFSESADGAPLVPNVLASRWKRHKARMGISLTFHQLRHFSASVLLDGGAEMGRVSKRLGHARHSITADVYAHVMRASDHDLAELVAERLRTS